MSRTKSIGMALLCTAFVWSTLLAGEAQAATVRIELNAPAGHPGVQITSASLTSDSLLVGQFSGFLATSGGHVSVSVPAAGTPNGLELAFAIPFGGVLSTYGIPAGSLVFGMPFFLPNPSPGGVVGPITTDPEGDDAYVVVSILPSFDDTEAPICLMSRPEPNLILAVIQDGQSGLASITVQLASNVWVEVPAFALGTTDPVEVLAEIQNLQKTATVILKAKDRAGNASYCKSVQRSSTRSRTFPRILR